ncbi:hypothetical protein ROZALSC1DRAFT_14288 [Rozella allomycis CSF55]|uniref:Complex 1 LYR protein domain-containing protein n=1 Tax=Rozella allomycis (strain CSF55) TaxID=988480 RepID=A0A4V1IZT7_ROZAC|nr:hypothetical protein ROZALSC1DRAFT_14288 [Rozella allomycis CSF55]
MTIKNDVLALYRKLVRVVHSKPREFQQEFQKAIRYEFDINRNIPRTQINTIEHLMRQGEKKYEIIKDKSVFRINVPSHVEKYFEEKNKV